MDPQETNQEKEGGYKSQVLSPKSFFQKKEARRHQVYAQDVIDVRELARS